MADKKAVNTAAQAQSDKTKKTSFFGKVKNFFKGIGKYFKDTKGELKKVVWPSKKQVFNNTIVVIVVVILSSLGISLIDYFFGLIIKLFFGS